MPNYDYRCDDCDTQDEHWRDIEQRDDCPTCQHCLRIMRRIILPTAVKFNGSGFYSTGG